MICSLNTIKEMRSNLTDIVERVKPLKGMHNALGESYSLTHDFYEALAKDIRNPESVINRINARSAVLSDPFHQQLRKQVGEELEVTTDGKPQTMYLIGSKMHNNPNAEQTTEVSLLLAPTSDVNDVRTYRFRTDSDTAINHTESVTIQGIGSAIIHSELRRIEREQAQNKTPNIDVGEDTEARAILTKMSDADIALGSRPGRNVNSLKGYHKVKKYTHGNTDQMIEMLKKLHVLGGSKATPQMLEYYGALIGSLHPKFFRDYNLYLKTNEEEAVGEVRLNEGSIYIGVAPTQEALLGASEAEVYTHEVIHTATNWALKHGGAEVRPIVRQLEQTMRTALRHIKAEDLLTVDPEVATARDWERAEQLHQYVFSDKNSKHEFLAHVLTNPRLKSLAQNIQMRAPKEGPQTLFERVVGFFTNLMNVAFGRAKFSDANLSVFDKANELVAALGELNNKHEDKLRTMNPVGVAMDALDRADGFLSRQFDKFSKGLAKRMPDYERLPNNATLFTKARFYTKASAAILTNKTYRKAFGLYLDTIGMKPGTSIREFVGSLFQSDDYATSAKTLMLLSDDQDRLRNNNIVAASKNIQEKFKQPLTEEEDVAITEVLLETQLSHLFRYRTGRKKRGYKDIQKLLTDDDYLRTQIGRVKHQLKEALGKDTERYNFLTNQANGLGYYFVTNQAGVGQLANADNMVRGYATNQRYPANRKLSVLVNEIASLSALTHLPKKQKASVARLIEDERAGIAATVDMYSTYQLASQQEFAEAGNQAHYFAGHLKEIFDDSIEIKIAPIKDERELIDQGYTRQFIQKPLNGDTADTPLGFYTTSAWGRSERLRGAVGLGKNHTRGTNMHSLKMMTDPYLGQERFRRDFRRVNAEMERAHAQMRKGEFDVTKADMGMMPIVDSLGQVTDFRYTMSKENKKKLLKKDSRMTQVLPQTLATIEHQARRNKLNEDLLKFLREDMTENWEEGEYGKDGLTRYTLIGPEVADPEMRDLYHMLPENFRKYISRRRDKTFAVRSDVEKIMFGYKHLQLSEMKGIRHLPGFLKQQVNMVEGLWTEFVKVSKAFVLLKMPMILVMNVVSNILFQIATGSTDIPALMRDYRDSFREVNDYLKNNREAKKLEIEIQMDKQALNRTENRKKLTQIIAQKEAELRRLQNTLNDSPADPLFKMGVYQTHIEEIENSTLTDSNRLTKHVNSKLEKAPKPVQWAAHFSYVTQKTAFYKISQEVLQQSDMIARLVQKKRDDRQMLEQARGKRDLPIWWTEDKEKGYPVRKELTDKEKAEFFDRGHQVLNQSLIDNYVNYAIPNNPGEEYLNRIGVFMFTKYLKRIQPIITSSFTSNPIKTALTLGIGVNALSMSSIYESAWAAKGFGWDGEFSIFNIVPTFSPLYHMENVFTPPIIKSELYFDLL